MPLTPFKQTNVLRYVVPVSALLKILRRRNWQNWDLKVHQRFLYIASGSPWLCTIVLIPWSALLNFVLLWLTSQNWDLKLLHRRTEDGLWAHRTQVFQQQYRGGVDSSSTSNLILSASSQNPTDKYTSWSLKLEAWRALIQKSYRNAAIYFCLLYWWIGCVSG